MATREQIAQSVLARLHKNWPHADEKTSLRNDLLLNDDQIVDLGTDLAEALNCNPTRSQIRACKTVGDLIDLLFKTQIGR